MSDRRQFFKGSRVVRSELLDDGVLVLRRVKPAGGLPRYVITLEHGDEYLLLHDCEGRLIADRLWWRHREALS